MQKDITFTVYVGMAIIVFVYNYTCTYKYMYSNFIEVNFRAEPDKMWNIHVVLFCW